MHRRLRVDFPRSAMLVFVDDRDHDLVILLHDSERVNEKFAF